MFSFSVFKDRMLNDRKKHLVILYILIQMVSILIKYFLLFLLEGIRDRSLYWIVTHINFGLQFPEKAQD